jgi:hypothetical protein
MKIQVTATITTNGNEYLFLLNKEKNKILQNPDTKIVHKGFKPVSLHKIMGET